jgi:hypothetical protein
MKAITKVLKLAIPVLLLAGCSKPVTKADFQTAVDMQSISNLFLAQGWPPWVKKAEAGELGSEASFPVTIGKTNEQQRHYIVTWKDHKWQISPTNH